MKPYYQDRWVTLWHADCRETDVWHNADALITDPPYGINYSSSIGQRIAGDRDLTARDDMLRTWATVSATGQAAVFGTWKARRPKGMQQILIWDKTACGMGDLRKQFGGSHEEIYLVGDWPKVLPRSPSVYRTTVQLSGKYGLVAKVGHPTPKPVELMRWLIARCSGHRITDPFAGSGSTLLAARSLNRPAVGVELDERYCEIAARRLETEQHGDTENPH